MVKFLLTHTVRQSNTTPQEITMSLEAIRGNYSLGKFNNNAEYPIEEVVNILEHRWTELALQKEKVELYGQAFRALISGDLGQDSWVEGDALTVYLRSVAKLTDEIVTVLPANLLFVIEHYGKNEITEKVIRICRDFKHIPKNQILILPLFMQNHWAIYTQIQDVGTLFCSLNHEKSTRKAFLPVWNLICSLEKSILKRPTNFRGTECLAESTSPPTLRGCYKRRQIHPTYQHRRYRSIATT